MMSSAAAQPQAPATVFRGGLIRTMDPGHPIVESLATVDGRIAARGCEHEVRAKAGAGAAMVDLGGGCLCPGFIDAHHHFTTCALFRQAVHLDRPEIDTVDRCLDALRERARRTPRGQWILAVGYDELRWREKRAPRLAELDAACPDHPLLAVHYTVHEGVASSRGLQAAGLHGAADPPRGAIVRDRRGRPTGRLLEESFSQVLTVATDQIISADPEAYLQAVAEHEDELFARGIVRVFDPGVQPALEAVLARAYEAGKLRLGLNLMVVGAKGMLSMPSDRLDGAATGAGPEQLRVGPLKIFMDGGKLMGVRLSPGEALASLGKTAWRALAARSLDGFRLAGDATLRPARDGRLHGGRLLYEVAEARHFFAAAQARGFSVAVHALGNEAIAQALEALPEPPGHRPPGVGPHRIEHFFITEPWQARRAAERGIAAAVQPYFVPLFAPQLLALGFPSPDRILPLRQLLDAGMCLAGSSDAPVDDPSPLRGMWAATARRLPTGEVLAAEQRIWPEEALALYTRGAAAAGGIADCCGTLAPGRRADLVWLDADPVSPGALEPPGPRVLGTWVGGERVFAA